MVKIHSDIGLPFRVNHLYIYGYVPVRKQRYFTRGEASLNIKHLSIESCPVPGRKWNPQIAWQSGFHIPMLVYDRLG